MSASFVKVNPATGVVADKVANTDWNIVSSQLDGAGHALIRQFLTSDQCADLRALYHQPNGYRKTVVMERFRFGSGEYKYFDYPLPSIVQDIRSQVYPRLAGVANSWMQQLKLDRNFPATHGEHLRECRKHGQQKSTPLILRYSKGGFNTLHQDLYGEVYFPLQAVILLSDPNKDFAGGEFVLTQQNPRAQSKAIVLTPDLGDMIIFTTNFRSVASRNGFYRAAMKHGVSEVTAGERYTLGVIFHDALT